MARSRRVLYVAWAPFFSGAERALLLTLRSLAGTGYEPIVLSGTEGEFSSQVRALGIDCATFSLRYMEWRNPLPGLRAVGAVLRLARRHRVSVIHANEMPSFQPAGYAARLLKLPAVTHVRFPDKADGYRWFFRTPFSRALFVSSALRAEAMAEAPDVFSGRSEVLHDAVEPQPEWSTDQMARCRRELGLRTDVPLVAMAGQIAEVKGIWDFIAAADIMRGTRAHFVVLGDDLRTSGVVRRQMESRVESLGLSHRFTFLGFRSDAPRVVQAFDIIAVPSHVEPLGNATLEAMAAGRPVVGSRVGGIPEMIVDQVTGVLTPPSDPGALANSITRLVEDATLRDRMSVMARRRSLDSFGLAQHGRRLQVHYDELRSRGASFHPSESRVA